MAVLRTVQHAQRLSSYIGRVSLNSVTVAPCVGAETSTHVDERSFFEMLLRHLRKLAEEGDPMPLCPLPDLSCVAVRPSFRCCQRDVGDHVSRGERADVRIAAESANQLDHVQHDEGCSVGSGDGSLPGVITSRWRPVRGSMTDRTCRGRWKGSRPCA